MLSGEEAARRVQGLAVKYTGIEELVKRYDHLDRVLLTASTVIQNLDVLTELENRRNEVEAELRQLREARQQELQSIINVPTPAKVRVHTSLKAHKDTLAINEGVRLFTNLTTHPAIEGRQVRIEAQFPNRSGVLRSQYVGFSTIRMTPGEDASTILHELGHWLEDMDKRILKQSLAFLKRRAGTEPTECLRDLTGNPHYGADERAWKDKFLDPYMGKDYHGEASEILSMGMEYLYRYPQLFAQHDPEYFAFVYNRLRGR